MKSDEFYFRRSSQTDIWGSHLSVSKGTKVVLEIPRVSELHALSTPTYIPGIFEYRTISHDITFRSQDFDLDHDQN